MRSINFLLTFYLLTRPQPRRLCVRWGPSPLPKKWAETPKFSDHAYCGQTAGWIKMALGMEVGLSLGDFVLDGDQPPSPKRVRSPLPNFCQISTVPKQLDSSRCHLVWRYASVQGTLCWMRTQPPSPLNRGRHLYSSGHHHVGQRPTFLVFVYYRSKPLGMSGTGFIRASHPSCY